MSPSSASGKNQVRVRPDGVQQGPRSGDPGQSGCSGGSCRWGGVGCGQPKGRPAWRQRAEPRAGSGAATRLPLENRRVHEHPSLLLRSLLAPPPGSLPRTGCACIGTSLIPGLCTMALGCCMCQGRSSERALGRERSLRPPQTACLAQGPLSAGRDRTGRPRSRPPRFLRERGTRITKMQLQLVGARGPAASGCTRRVPSPVSSVELSGCIILLKPRAYCARTRNGGFLYVIQSAPRSSPGLGHPSSTPTSPLTFPRSPNRTGSLPVGLGPPPVGGAICPPRPGPPPPPPPQAQASPTLKGTPSCIHCAAHLSSSSVPISLTELGKWTPVCPVDP